MYLKLFCTHTHRLKGNNHPNAEINVNGGRLWAFPFLLFNVLLLFL